jgi:FkbM family methyltransferase
MKKIAKSVLGSNVWLKLGEAKQEWLWRKIKCHAAPDLRDLLFRYLNFNDGFYVEVGANDGRSFSNTFHLEHSQEWSGILIEPILHKHFDSKRHRSEEKNVFIYGACVDEAYKDNFIQLEYSNLMTTPVESTDKNAKEWAKFGEEFLQKGETSVPIWAPAFSLNQILEMAKAPEKIDFISIDVEGGELAVLNGMDFKKFKFSNILIETDKNSKAYLMLEDNNFQNIESRGNNHLFIPR